MYSNKHYFLFKKKKNSSTLSFRVSQIMYALYAANMLTIHNSMYKSKSLACIYISFCSHLLFAVNLEGRK